MEESRNNESIPSPAKRSKNPGVRVQGGRIYDSQNGRTCHQCRQKTMDFTASCKAVRQEKPCTIQFCHKCLLNRYGEKAEEVSAMDDWSCPKCRGLCNCSFCMKKKGYEPTGILAHRAKLTGFSSVHALLSHDGDNVENTMKDITVSPRKSLASKKAPVQSKRCRDKENCNFEKNGTENISANVVMEKNPLGVNEAKKPSKRLKQTTLVSEYGNGDVRQIENELPIKNPKTGLPLQPDNNIENLNAISKDENVAKPPKPKGRPPNIIRIPFEDVVLPQGKPLTTVAGVELPGEDVGPALQFLEFCKFFSKVLDIKKGEPEAIIRELVRGFSSQRRCRVTSAIIQFQIRLLSFILEDTGEKQSLEIKGENSWLKALDNCLNEYKHLSVEFPLDFVNDYSGYNNLNSSTKLRILLFLCDEVLGTEALRKFLDEENAKFVEEEKGRREHITAAKKKEQLIKQKLKDDFAKAMISSEGHVQLSISEHEQLISKIRDETEKAHQEMLESIEHLPKKKEAAIRTAPLFLEKDGIVFWRLESFNKCSSIILQDIEKWSVITTRDKWFMFDDAEQHMVEKYLSFLSFRRAREQKQNLKNFSQVALDSEDDSSDNSEP